MFHGTQKQQSLQDLFNTALKMFLADRVAIVQKKILQDLQTDEVLALSNQYSVFAKDKKPISVSSQVAFMLREMCSTHLTSVEDIQQFIHLFFEFTQAYQYIEKPKLKKILMDNESIIRELDGDFYVLKADIEKYDTAVMTILREMMAIQNEKSLADQATHVPKGILGVKVGDRTYHEDVICTQISLLKNLYMDIHSKTIGKTNEATAFQQVRLIEQNIKKQVNMIIIQYEEADLAEVKNYQELTPEFIQEDKKNHIVKLKLEYLMKLYSEFVIKNLSFSQVETKAKFLKLSPVEQKKLYIYSFILKLFALKLHLAEKALLFEFFQSEYNNTFSSSDPNNQKRKDMYKCCYLETTFDKAKAKLAAKKARLATMGEKERDEYLKKEVIKKEQKRAEEENRKIEKEIKVLKFEITHNMEGKLKKSDSTPLSPIEIVDYHDHFNTNDLIALQLTTVVNEFVSNDMNDDEFKEAIVECFNEYSQRLDDINNGDQFLINQFIESWKTKVENLLDTELTQLILTAANIIEGKEKVTENEIKKNVNHWIEMADMQIRNICRPLISLKQPKNTSEKKSELGKCLNNPNPPKANLAL